MREVKIFRQGGKYVIRTEDTGKVISRQVADSLDEGQFAEATRFLCDGPECEQDFDPDAQNLIMEALKIAKSNRAERGLPSTGKP